MPATTASPLILPIRMSERALHRAVHQGMPNPLVEELTGKRRVTARSVRPPVLVFDDGQLLYRLVISFELEQDALFTTLTANGSIRLDFGTTYEITPDYRLITATTLYEHAWITKPKLGVGGNEMPVSGAAGWVLDRLRERIAQQIDKQIQQQLRLPQLMQRAWDTLQQPQLLSADHNAYIVLHADSLAVTEPRSEEGYLHFQLHAGVAPEVLLAAVPPAPTTYPLPPFAFAEAQPQALRPVMLQTQLPFDLLTPIVQQQVAGKTFGADKRRVTVHHLDLSAVGEQLLIDATLSGSFDGSLRFRCRPVLVDGTIQLEDLSLDLDTDNLLQRTAGWLLKSTILKRLQSGVREGVEKGLQTAEQQLTERLNGDLPVEGITLDAVVDAVRIEALSLVDNALHARVSALARVAMTIDRLPAPVAT